MGKSDVVEEETSMSQIHRRISVTREQVNEAVTLLRRRLCGGVNQPLHQISLLPDAEVNRKQLQSLLTHTIVNAYNNSALLLGPRGCGKSLVLECVLADLQSAYPERFSIVRLSGFLHADEYCALKEIARQLCVENELFFSKAASFSENLQFLTAMLKDQSSVFCTTFWMQCSLLHRKLQLLALVSAWMPTSSWRRELLQDVMTLPTDSNFGHADYAMAFNIHTKKLLEKDSLRSLITKFTEVDLSPQSILDLGFGALCSINRDTGLLTEANFKKACLILRPKPKLEMLKGLSVLELYLLVVMNRLEGQNRDVYNFNTIFYEYERLCGLHNTCDRYSRPVSQRAFEHLLDRELIDYAERFTTVEYTPVKLLISSQELKDGLHANSMCPTTLHQWFAHENFK